MILAFFRWSSTRSACSSASSLHGHDYEKNLKLEALTGDIYGTGTRHKCEKLTSKELARIHTALRSSSDFAAKMAELIGG